MPSYPIPKDLVAEYSAACQIVSQYEELRALGPVDPDKAAWAGQELETKTLIERIAILTAALKSAWECEEPDEGLIFAALFMEDAKMDWRTGQTVQTVADYINGK